MTHETEAKRLNELKRQAEMHASKTGLLEDWQKVTDIQKQISSLAWKASGLPEGGRFDPDMVERFNNRRPGLGAKRPISQPE